MAQTNAQGNKHPVALHQNHAIVFIEMFESNAKYQHLIQLNMPKSKWDDDEDPTINNLYNIDKTFEYNK